ncbi:MAG TPA: ATP-binding protein [Coleofasciculaceae cyanobacterium]
MFERLQEALQQTVSTLGEGVVVLTEDVWPKAIRVLEERVQRFTLVASERFSALLLGTQQGSESSNGNGLKATPLYQVGLTFDPDAIASFLTQLAPGLDNDLDALTVITQARACLKPNDAAIQSEFTLSLVEILASSETHSLVPPDFIYSHAAVCQPLVEEALHQQIEQERLLHQVTTQIRHSLELPVILETAVEQVRNFLQVDRLLIYQFDEFNRANAATSGDCLVVSDQSDLSTEVSTAQLSLLNATVRWGCVTYEARASDRISSVLNLIEKEDCSLRTPNCREKCRQGMTLAIDDVETAYETTSCFLDLLQRTQVRALLAAPILVQGNLWGLLIAHQCSQPRHWQESEKTFLKQIAEHLTVAIYQAQLYAQLQQQKNTLEHQVIERTQELVDALKASQSASLAKSEFLAAMSHELRTPLTCVIGMSATLLRWSYGQEGTKTVPLAKQRRYLKTIQESGEHLLDLINDILDFSQVEAGKAVLNISEFSLNHLTQQILRTLREKASHQKVNLEVDFRVNISSMNGSSSQDDRFCADQRRVKQILFNLLGNAIKFTPEGGTVILRVWREHHSAVFQIEDTGIGIAQDQIPLLFQKFQQLDSAYHRTYEGTGLGLALTKQLVELHGGRIEVESMVDNGSVFTVWLPAQPLTSISSTKAGASSKDKFNSPGSIVLVEDHEESATPICEMLTAAGYQVVWLINGSTAVEQIKLLQPKAVIVDWQLLEMDGYEIIYHLRNTPATQQIKVLALTTATLGEEDAYNLSVGVDDYLPKPIEPDQLLHKVMALIS